MRLTFFLDALQDLTTCHTRALGDPLGVINLDQARNGTKISVEGLQPFTEMDPSLTLRHEAIPCRCAP
jgi:hypothetical protein